MKTKWGALVSIVAIALAIVSYKAHLSPVTPAPSAATPPRVVMAAVLSEANTPGDSCAEIIRVVRAARDRGVAVQELDAGSQPELLTRYHVFAYPTVLILDRDGKETARYIGEGPATVAAVRAALEQLR